MGVGDGEGHVAVIGLTVGDAGDDRGVGVLICHMAAAAQQLLVQPDVLVLGMGDHVHAADDGDIAVDDAAVGIGVALRQKGGAEAAIALRDLAEVAAGESAASAGLDGDAAEGAGAGDQLAAIVDGDITGEGTAGDGDGVGDGDGAEEARRWRRRSRPMATAP